MAVMILELLSLVRARRKHLTSSPEGRVFVR